MRPRLGRSCPALSRVHQGPSCGEGERRDVCASRQAPLGSGQAQARHQAARAHGHTTAQQPVRAGTVTTPAPGKKVEHREVTFFPRVTQPATTEIRLEFRYPGVKGHSLTSTHTAPRGAQESPRCEPAGGAPLRCWLAAERGLHGHGPQAPTTRSCLPEGPAGRRWARGQGTPTWSKEGCAWPGHLPFLAPQSLSTGRPALGHRQPGCGVGAQRCVTQDARPGHQVLTAPCGGWGQPWHGRHW